MSSKQIGSLIESYLAGNQAAFEQIHETYKTTLWRYLYSHANNREDAEDLFNIVSLSISRSLASLKDPSAIKGWVCQVARNRLYDYYKNKKPAMENLDHHAAGLASRQQSPEQQSIGRQRLMQIKTCIGALPEPQRDYCTLHFLAGVTQKSISEQYQLNLNSLKTSLSRAKLKIIACLEKSGFMD